jgi:hypothetical protein
MVILDELLSAFNTWEGGKTRRGNGEDLIERREILAVKFLRKS